jgi:hypothetical protein
MVRKDALPVDLFRAYLEILMEIVHSTVESEFFIEEEVYFNINWAWRSLAYILF